MNCQYEQSSVQNKTINRFPYTGAYMCRSLTTRQGTQKYVLQSGGTPPQPLHQSKADSMTNQLQSSNPWWIQLDSHCQPLNHIGLVLNFPQKQSYVPVSSDMGSKHRGRNLGCGIAFLIYICAVLVRNILLYFFQ